MDKKKFCPSQYFNQIILKGTRFNDNKKSKDK